MSQKTKSFIKGTIILTAAGMVAKFLSMFFRIPITHLIGDEGIGYYQMTYPIYTLMLAVSYVGLPSAISKIVSEKLVHKKYYEAHKVFQYTFFILLVTGGATSLFLFLGADWLIKVQGWVPAAKYPLWGLAFSPLFVAVMGAYRGYFQGMQDMYPTAISQIAESFGRVFLGVGATYVLLGSGIAVAAGGAAFGATAGGILGTLTLILMYLSRRKEIMKKVQSSRHYCKQESFLRVIKSVLYIAVPISMGAAVNSLMAWIDSTLVVRRLLAVGFTEEVASALFGQLGKVMTLTNVPLTFSMAMVVSLVPTIAEAVERKDKKELHDKIQMGTRLGMLLGLPSAVGLCLLAQPILTLIYRQNDAGGDILALLSISLIFVVLAQGFTGMLQGMGRFFLPIRNLLIAAVIKIVITYVMVAGPLQVRGAALASIAAYGVFAALNFYEVKKLSGYKIEFIHVVLKPLLAVVAMGGMTLFTYYQLAYRVGNSLATLGAIGAAGVIYIVMLLLTGALQEEDFALMPKGEKIAQLLKKFRLLRY